MKTTYRLDVNLGSGEPSALEDVLHRAYEGLDAIALRDTGVSLGAEDRLSGSFSLLPGGFSGPRISALHDRTAEGARTVGLRYEGAPGTEGVPELRIDLLLRTADSDSGSTRGPLRLVVEVARPQSFASSVEAPPAFVQDILVSEGVVVNGRELPLDARTMGRDEVEARLVPLLLDAERGFPVVVFSPVQLTQRPILDPGPVQDDLLGLACVVVLESRSATFPLPEQLGSPFACYDGAVRIYFPGLGPEAIPGDHPMWRPDEQLAEDDFGRAVLGRILRRQGRHTPDPEPLRWDLLSATSLKRKLGSLEDEALVATLREREADLAGRIAELESELRESRMREDSLRGEIHALRSEVAALRASMAEADEEGEGATGTRAPDAESVVRSVVASHPERLVLALNSRSQLRGYPFEDLEALGSALTFLATTYWEARFAGRSCPDLKGELQRTATGFSYQPHQSDGTTGRYPEDYVTTWEGREYPLTRHVGKGTARDRRRCVRIAFAVDDEREVIVLGYFGQHQRTTAT